jgi:hypothetical protein
MCIKQPKLLVELVPKTCHYSNVRTTLTTEQWNKIRKISYALAGNVCEICNESGKTQGFKHNVECHEIWEYNDQTHTQILIGLISLCPICHLVKHIGRAMAMGKELIAYKQLAKVNKWTTKQIQEHIVESFELHKQRSKFKWELDISILAQEPYNIQLKEIKERIFEIKKFKKKKKTVKKGPKKIHGGAKIANALKKTKQPSNKRPPKN